MKKYESPKFVKVQLTQSEKINANGHQATYDCSYSQ